MFGNKSNRSDRNVVDTLIGPQAVITGDISFSGVLYVEGNIFGKVIADEGVSATLVVAEKGRIDGEVRAPVIVINGRLDGDVYAADRVELGGGALRPWQCALQSCGDACWCAVDWKLDTY